MKTGARLILVAVGIAIAFLVVQSIGHDPQPAERTAATPMDPTPAVAAEATARDHASPATPAPTEAPPPAAVPPPSPAAPAGRPAAPPVVADAAGQRHPILAELDEVTQELRDATEDPDALSHDERQALFRRGMAAYDRANAQARQADPSAREALQAHYPEFMELMRGIKGSSDSIP